MREIKSKRACIHTRTRVGYEGKREYVIKPFHYVGSSYIMDDDVFVTGETLVRGMAKDKEALVKFICDYLRQNDDHFTNAYLSDLEIEWVNSLMDAIQANTQCENTSTFTICKSLLQYLFTRNHVLIWLRHLYEVALCGDLCSYFDYDCIKISLSIATVE